MENTRFKVGDRVKIKSLDWYNENKNDNYDVVVDGGWHFSKPMSTFCGKELIIEGISYATNPPHYRMKDNMFAWTDEMIEGLVGEKSQPKFNIGDIVYSRTWQHNVIIQEILPDCFYKVSDLFRRYWLKTHEDTLCKDFVRPTTEYTLPDGHIFKDENGNVINATKIILEKKKKEYPKTYEECCYVTGFENTEMVFEDDYRDMNPPKEQWKRLDLMNRFYRLLVCRDAYWKIAGEEMGLGKPWKPNGNPVYAITRNDGCIFEMETGGNDEVFEFPTQEMRDAFKKNFDPDIENCKELL